MAQIQFTDIAAISGSIAGTTYARNRFGIYGRARATPVNPQSSGQAAVRAYFAEAAVAWSAASASRRAAYETFAAGTPVQNKVGQTVYLTGFQWWMSYWTLFRRAGLTAVQAAAADVPFVTGFASPAILPNADVILTDAPSTGLMDEDSTGTGTAANNLRIDWSAITGLDPANDLVALLWVSPPQLPSINFYKGPWYIAAAVESLTGTIPDDEQVYDLSTLFGVTVPNGAKVFTRFRIIDNNTLQSPVTFKTYTALTYTVP